MQTILSVVQSHSQLTCFPSDGLAVSGSAPKIFSRTTRSGLPHVAVVICSCFALLAYLTVKDGSGTVFIWLSSFCTTACIITWFSIGVTYLRFYKGMKAQGIDRKKQLPFAPKVQPFAAWWCVCGTALVLFVRVSRSRAWRPGRLTSTSCPLRPTLIS